MADIFSLVGKLNNLSGELATNANYISNIADAFIVRPKDNIYGINGFIFSEYSGALGEEETTGENDITDHYVEDNIAAQDHIAVKPLIFRLTGYVCEIDTSRPDGFKFAGGIASKLTTLSPYLPKLTAQAQQIFNEAAKAKSAADVIVDTSQSSWDIFKKQIPFPERGNRQRIVWTYFETMRTSRRIVSVETPWGFIENAAVMSVSSSQRDSKFNTEISVTFKEIRKISNIFTRKLKAEERAYLQKLEQQDKGLSQGIPVSKDSRAFQLTRKLAGD